MRTRSPRTGLDELPPPVPRPQQTVGKDVEGTNTPDIFPFLFYSLYVLRNVAHIAYIFYLMFGTVNGSSIETISILKTYTHAVRHLTGSCNYVRISDLKFTATGMLN